MEGGDALEQEYEVFREVRKESLAPTQQSDDLLILVGEDELFDAHHRLSHLLNLSLISTRRLDLRHERRRDLVSENGLLLDLARLAEEIEVLQAPADPAHVAVLARDPQIRGGAGRKRAFEELDVRSSHRGSVQL